VASKISDSDTLEQVHALIAKSAELRGQAERIVADTETLLRRSQERHPPSRYRRIGSPRRRSLTITYRLIRAAVVVSGAAIVISIFSSYLAWFAALLTR
jgi:hypothetical protein